MAKAVISTTYSNTYLYFLPIVTFCWNKLGVDVICFMPEPKSDEENIKLNLCLESIDWANSKNEIEFFTAPEHKEATYAQCSRLYGACLDLPEDEILIIGDVDMANFKVPPHEYEITIFGADLVPQGQYPMCYASGMVKHWRSAMKINGRTYQKCLDDLLGDIDCENMRGNYWSKDQQTLWENTCDISHPISRARPNTQFADHRCDRDDVNWRAYVNDELIDAHLWRDGFTDQNHANIMELMKMKFPNEDFTWLDTYRNEYLKLL